MDSPERKEEKKEKQVREERSAGQDYTWPGSHRGKLKLS